MARIFTKSSDEAPRIDRDSVVNFFEQRAEKAATLGPVRAVIYQDKNPRLAESRDTAEKKLLFPKLDLQPSNTVLDLGCGTGRWAQVLVDHCRLYHGIDVSAGLIRIASEAFGHYPNASFSVCSVDQMPTESSTRYDRVLCCGVLIYLNDDEVLRTLDALSALLAPKARILLREPIGLEWRLTIKEHFSDDMDQTYNAIYRTENELMGMIGATLGKLGWRMRDCGDVYSQVELNNRSDTKQRWFILEQ
jgi:cyclopropane fatty-acyl-phospholipid synthase-like methyltransferase